MRRHTACSAMAVAALVASLGGLWCSCQDRWPVARSLGVEPKHYYWDEMVCDVNMNKLNNFLISRPYRPEVNAFHMVVCLRSGPTDAPREPCGKWLERQMSTQRWAEINEELDLQETDRSAAAQWWVASLTSSDPQFRARNPSPSAILNWHRLPASFISLKKRMPDNMLTVALEKEYLGRARHRPLYREDWRVDQAWRKVIPSEHPWYAQEIATLQQRIMAIELGLCPYCCIRFGVTVPGGAELALLFEHLRRDARVWFAGLGDFAVRDDYIGIERSRLAPTRDDNEYKK